MGERLLQSCMALPYDHIWKAVFALTYLPTSKTGFGQVKIMKEFD